VITLRHRRRSPGLEALIKSLRLYIRELRAARHLA
jgi:hypothetical protein